MFSFPQPPDPEGTSTASKAEYDRKNNTIQITENALTMRTVLSLIYPCMDTNGTPFKLVLNNISTAKLFHFLQTSIKYDFPKATYDLKKHVIKWTGMNPKDAALIYAASYVLAIPEISNVARRNCMDHLNLNDLVEAPFMKKDRVETYGVSSGIEIIDPYEDKFHDLLSGFSLEGYQELLCAYLKLNQTT